MALVRIVAKLPNGKIIVLWENENVNSVHGHLPCRHIGGQKEEQGINLNTKYNLLYTYAEKFCT